MSLMTSVRAGDAGDDRPLAAAVLKDSDGKRHPFTRRKATYALYRSIERLVVLWLLRLEAEKAHSHAIKALRFGYLRPKPDIDESKLEVRAFGFNFPNPIGPCAGLDKDAEAIEGILQSGFGFAEFGTLTPRKQNGTDRPRVFRLPKDEAVINRFGFNNQGHAPALERLRSRKNQSGIIGINIGANRDSSDRVADYIAGIETFAMHANYLVINVSSPNTPGLRELQAPSELDNLLARAVDARDRVAKQTPLLLKIAPDLSLTDLDDIVAVAKKRKIDGMIVSNTTVMRPDTLRDPNRRETGGLSGKPLFDLSTRILAETYVRVERAFPLIGVGGIDSADTAWKKIRAGATLIQLYTALIYKGLSLIDDIKIGLIEHLDRGKHESLAEIVGADAAGYSCK